MNKLTSALLMAGVLSTSVCAIDVDRYYGIGIGNVNYEQTGYSDGKSVHLKLGMTSDEGFGMELEYSETVDSLTHPTATDFDLRTFSGYATYKIIMNGEFSLKGRLGMMSERYDWAGGTVGDDWSDAAYGLQLNYEPMDGQIFYVDYTINKNGGNNNLVFLSFGIHQLF